MPEGPLVAAKILVYHALCFGSASRYFTLKAAVTRTAVRLGAYERRYMRLLPRLIHPGDVVVDAGANVGAYTHALSALTGPNGRVVAFEPVPDVADVLERSTRRLANVRVVRAALSDRSQAAVRMTVPYLPGGVPEPALAALHGSPRGERPLAVWKTFDVALCRLDDHDGVRNVRFIKADLEGHEQAFLAGADATIRRWRPVVQLEAAGLDRGETLDWAYKLDYMLLTFVEGRLTPVTGHDALSLNVYLVPSERRADLMDIQRLS